MSVLRVVTTSTNSSSNGSSSAEARTYEMSPPLSQLAVTRATATAVPSATTASKPRRTTSRLYRGSTTTAKSALLIHQSGPLIGLAEQPFEVERTREHLDAVVRARPF